MSEEEISWYILDKSEEEKKYYFDKLNDKLERVKSENNKIQIWMIILAFIFVGFDMDLVNSINLGFININPNEDIIKLFIPLVFSFYLLQFAAINYQRGLILNTLKNIGNNLNNMENLPQSSATYTNSILRILMPFSLAEEISSGYMKKGKLDKITLILMLPLLLIILIPFIFQIYSTVQLIISQWVLGWFEKIVIIATVWMIFVIVGYYIKIVMNGHNSTQK